ncbi:hypothetical protein F444_18500 [Phytophthora nicotianae P1976]|uniref:Uncharacterized protein n=1 Tax=Phytophthora nicotianae P1976 TaxID=1317066 RepID=A0A080ZB55_PHYNI|nr:hypothetical protein F444_18500 [Phytophthora nicotianae P1976]
MDEQTLILTFKRAMPNERETAYKSRGVHLNSMPKTVQHFERLEQSERRQGLEWHGKNWKKSSGKNGGDKNNEGGESRPRRESTSRSRRPRSVPVFGTKTLIENTNEIR